jgi:N-acetylmuramoyl-L-alanine amidase
MKPILLCLDAGHGNRNTGNGFDSGIVAGGMRECDIALDWVLTVKQYCVQAGIPVFLTRGNNTDADPVGTRAARAAEAGCTHFLSIHTNGATGKASGVEAYYRDENDKQWAQIVLNCGVSATGLKSRGLKTEQDSQHSRLAVLGGPKAMAACLLETGFLDNVTDRSIISVKATRIKFAERLVTAIEQIRGGH